MMTVNEVSRITGVSARTLHYYDEIGLLKPAAVTEAGYRLYDDESLNRLEQILLFRELEFPLKDIRKIITSPNFDKSEALRQQIELLTLKKERLERLIELAQRLETGGDFMDFKAFDKKKIKDYEAQAKEKWGGTEAFGEYEKKTAGYTAEKQNSLAENMMKIFAEFGEIKDGNPASSAAQTLVEKLRNFITDNYYTCTKPILAGLGEMYRAGGEMTDNIDAAGGKGTAEFAATAIKEYCK